MAKFKKKKGSRPRKNPEKSSFPWVAALIGAGVGVGVAYKCWSGPSAPPPVYMPPAPQPGPWSQPQAPRAQPFSGMNGHGQVSSVDRHGIPVVNLPGESAQRTAQARMYLQPPPGAVAPGQGGQIMIDPTTGQQVLVPETAPPTENFGGGDNGMFGDQRF